MVQEDSARHLSACNRPFSSEPGRVTSRAQRMTPETKAEGLAIPTKQDDRIKIDGERYCVLLIIILEIFQI